MNQTARTNTTTRSFSCLPSESESYNKAVEALKKTNPRETFASLCRRLLDKEVDRLRRHAAIQE